jgi:hypothetical protein
MSTFRIHPYPGSELTCAMCAGSVEDHLTPHVAATLTVTASEETKLDRFKHFIEEAAKRFLTEDGESWRWNEDG